VFLNKGETCFISAAGAFVRHCPLLVHVCKTARWCSSYWCSGFMQQSITDTSHDIACTWAGYYYTDLSCHL